MPWTSSATRSWSLTLVMRRTLPRDDKHCDNARELCQLQGKIGVVRHRVVAFAPAPDNRPGRVVTERLTPRVPTMLRTLTALTVVLAALFAVPALAGATDLPPGFAESTVW